MLKRDNPNVLLQRRKQELLKRYIGKKPEQMRRYVVGALGEFKIMQEMTLEEVDRVIRHIDELPISYQGGIFDHGEEVSA